MTAFKRGARNGAIAGLILLALALITPGLHEFLYRNPVPRLFELGSFIWWMTYAVIPPILAAQFTVSGITIAIGAVGGALAGHLRKNRFAAITVVLTAIILWFSLLFWLGSSMVHAH